MDKKNIIIIIIVLLVLLGGYKFFMQDAPKGTDNIEEMALDAQMISEELENGQAVLLDVRTDQELAETGMALNANHFDLARLQSGELPEHSKSLKTYIYCKTGARADQAKEILEANGFEQVVNIGGFTDWVESGGEAVGVPSN